MTDVNLNGTCYDDYQEHLGSLADLMVTVTNDIAIRKFGEQAHLEPTTIEITPESLDTPFFVAMAWHETPAKENPAVFQLHDYAFKIAMFSEDMYLYVENGPSYCLTTRQAMLLADMASIALMRSSLSMPPLDH